MRIALSGSTGLVGSVLVTNFLKQGHTVIPMLRPQSKNGIKGAAIRWDYTASTIDRAALENLDAIIHLGGVSIADQKWTPEYKKEILNSRVNSTAFLSKTISELKNPPKVFICASAIGFYGSRDAAQPVTEESEKGKNFLADVCEKWEAATQAAVAKTRVVNLRLATILSEKGGALAKMLPIFQYGGGGIIGNGKQMFSWIAVSEIPHIVLHVINKPQLRGPVNVSSPNPVSNKEFTKTFGRVIGRPTILPLPAFAVKMMFGEMGQDLLLDGAKVLPKKLLDSGYGFTYPTIEKALRVSLG